MVGKTWSVCAASVLLVATSVGLWAFWGNLKSEVGAPIAYIRSDLPDPTLAGPREAHAQLLKNLDVNIPGRGLIDYVDYPVGDVPKSYAMILIAELVRQRDESFPHTSAHAQSAGRWLLDHADEDGDGIIGWGVPVAWDAFSDGSENPKDLEYTIATALVIQSLLDWIQTASDAPREQILATIDRAFNPYLSGTADSPSGLAAYSLAASDRRYNCFNPAACLAGQLQRYSQIIETPKRAEALQSKADQIMQVMLDEHQQTVDGHWYWNYSIEEHVPNDVPHACYIIAGIGEYIESGGALATSFDFPAVLAHLHDYTESDLQTWYAWPNCRQPRIDDPPRLYGLSIALMLASTVPGFRAEADSLARQLKDYRRVDGFYQYRPDNPRIINEYQSYALAALSHYLSLTGEAFDVPPADLASPHSDRRPIQQGGLDETTTVPFVMFTTSRGEIGLRLDVLQLSAAFVNSDGTSWKLPPRRVPLALVVSQNGDWLTVTRTLWSSRIECWQSTEYGRKWKAVRTPGDVQQSLFRHATAFADHVVLVTYDPVRHRNTLRRLISTDTQQWEFDASFHQEIVCNADLGYEHQPHILSAEFDGELLLTCGPSLHRYRCSTDAMRTTNVTTAYLAEDMRVLELAVGKQRVAALCQLSNRTHSQYQRSAKGAEAPRFAIVDLGDLSTLKEFQGGDIPFNLRLHGSDTQVSLVHSAEDLADLFRQELKRCKASGVMSLGINNREGEAVWSQSYYLTGFIDLLTGPDWTGGNAELSLLLRDVRRRLDVEMALLDRMLLNGPGLDCQVFAVDRQHLLHVVQTGKMLLLLKRYLLCDDQVSLASFSEFQRAVVRLEGHVEQIAQATGEGTLVSGRFYLKWPKGSAFKYDGTGIPYNHQNCWAAGLLYHSELTDLDVRTTNAARDIAELVLDREGFRDPAPRHQNAARNADGAYHWLYWWGSAKEGWTKDDGVSVNTPDWQGDGKNVALARYRTFDAIAVLCAARRFPAVIADDALLDYFTRAVEEDGLEPFLIPYLRMHKRYPKLDETTAVYHLRVDSQPDWRNAVWSYRLLGQQLAERR